MLYVIEDLVELDIPIDYFALSKVNYSWHPYHPSKSATRFACSITSLDGKDNLDVNFEPLYQYNAKYGTSYNEMVFNTPTEHSAPYQYLLSEFDVGRSHYLRLPKSGYFPWHRDADPTAIRLVHTIKNCTPDKLVWLLDDKILPLQDNKWYFINTTKKHCVFAFDESLFAVFNVSSSKENIIKLYQHMVIT